MRKQKEEIERAYRRGYDQGFYFAVARIVCGRPIGVLKRKIEKWRYRNHKGRMSQPPGQKDLE